MVQPSDDQIICVRVFLSSTFRGLSGVRDYLRRNVFPEIELEYRKRGIGFSPVDLQWGITEEEALEGKTVELCLGEIERCHPFFLGLVGARAGWKPVPEECSFRTERIAQFCRSHAGRTITELEFLYNHYTLANSADAGILFLGEELDDDWGSPRAPAPAAAEETADAMRKMVEETYGPQRFQEKLRSREDLARAVRELLITRLEELTEGEQFDSSRSSIRRNRNRQALLRNSGFCREADLKNILSLAQSPEKSVILITGPSGSGKSTLLTFLHEAFQASGRTAFIRYKQDALLSPQDIWESIGAEAGYDAPEDPWIRASASASMAYLLEWFIRQQKEVVLLIDDIDACQMPVGSRKDFLDECVNILPDHVKLILTARSGAFDPDKHPEVRFCPLAPLDAGAKRKALSDLETVYGKRFGPEVTDIILSSEKCCNPEYLMWLVKYLHENAVFENLAEITEAVLREDSLETLIQRVLGISLKNANGRAERLYACLALVPEGLTEQELQKLFPRSSFRSVCTALGKLGSAVQYDQAGRIHLVSKTLIQLLLSAETLTEYTACYLFKRLLPVLSSSDPARHALVCTRLKLRSGKPGSLFSRMTQPEFCKALAEDRDLWNRALEEAYHRGEISDVISGLMAGRSHDIHPYLYVLEWFADFLEDRGEYAAAIQILKFVEADLCDDVGSFHYGTGAVYAGLLILYCKNRDFGMARLILRHMGFILKENINAGRLPPGSDYLRLNYLEAVAVYSQLCPGGADDLVSAFMQLTERMDGQQFILKKQPVLEPVNSFCPRLCEVTDEEHYVIGQLLQPKDYRTVFESDSLHFTADERMYIKWNFVGDFQLHNLPGVLFHGGKTERLNIREYNYLMDCRRCFFLPLKGMYLSSHEKGVPKKQDFDLYLALSGYCPKRMGSAYGFDGKQYLIYGYHEAFQPDEASYLFWLLSDGIKTTKEIVQQIIGMFKEPDEYAMMREAGQSIRYLYRNDLIWFDEKSDEGAVS